MWHGRKVDVFLRRHLMKVLNTSRFIVKVGDKLEYNQDAFDWFNDNIIKKRNKDPWPMACEINKRNPTVGKYAIREKGTFCAPKVIELHVIYDDKHTGITGLVRGKKTDVWCLDLDGTLPSCPHPIFIK
jgi:hypothetical protein